VRAPPVVGWAACALEHRVGAVPGPTSLAHGLRKQAANPCQAGRTLRRPGQALWCCGWAAAGRVHTTCAGWAQFRPGSRFRFKISFSILYSVSTEFKLQKFMSKYPELQKLRNQFCWIHNFMIYLIKLFSKPETFLLEPILLKLE
jgi:hypothetical protein